MRKTPLRNNDGLASFVKPGVSCRADFPLIPSKAALLIIDIQEYLSLPSKEHSQYYNYFLPTVLENIRSLTKSIRDKRSSEKAAKGCEVIFIFLEALTDDSRDVSLDYKLSGPKLAQLPGPSNPTIFLAEVHPAKNDILISKTSCSVFQSTNLEYVLRNLQIEQVIVCGQLTDQCVESAVRDAADLGFFVTVVEDACLANSLQSHENGLSGMKGFARILSTQTILQELEDGCTETPAVHEIPTTTATTTSSPDVITDCSSTVISLSKNQPMFCPMTTSKWGKSMNVQPRNFYDETFLHLLKVSGVEFIRFATIDALNNMRCKSIPTHRFSSILQKKQQKDVSCFDNIVPIAEVCMACYNDTVIPETNLSAKNVLVMKPDLSTLSILPFGKSKTAIVFGIMQNQKTKEVSPLCSRGLLARVIQTAINEYHIGFNVGAEIEFCLFQQDLENGVPVPVDDSSFANAITLDDQELFLSDLTAQLQSIHIDIEQVHSESASGQVEIVLPYQIDPMRLADNVVLTREVIQNCAKLHHMRAVFLPKIFANQAGNGMHLHLSLRKTSSIDSNRENAFPNYSDGSTKNNENGVISALGESFMEGILHHLPALTSITLPSNNSFKRVGPGCWTGSNVSWDIEDKDSPLRVCLDLATGMATNVEFKLSDSKANIYLELASVLSCGLDGIIRNLKLRPSASESDESIMKKPESLLPCSFKDSLECLAKDSFLTSILGEELTTAYIGAKRAELKDQDGTSLEQDLLQAMKVS